MPQKAASYLRVSTQDQADRALPIDGQRSDVERYAAEHGIELVAEYADPGITGTVGPDKRPGLRQLIQDASTGRFDTLLVWDDSRLARDTALAGWLRWELRGVEIIAVTSPQASQIETGIRAILSAEQVRQIRAASRRGLQEAFRQDRRHGTAPLGYRWEGDTLIPTEGAPFIARLFERVASGTGTNQLTKEIGWSPGRLLYTLRSPVYAGGRVYGRRTGGKGRRVRRPPSEWQVRWDKHEPIVSRETWHAVQTILDGNKRFPAMSLNHGSVAFSGLFWHDCGSRIKLSAWAHLAKTPGRTFYWKCKGCAHRFPANGWTARLVATAARELAAESLAEEWAAQIAAARSEGVDEGVAASEAVRLSRERDRLIDAITSGLVSDTRALASRLDSVQSELATAEQRLREIRSRAKAAPTVEEIRARLLRFASMADQLAALDDVDYAARAFVHMLFQRIEYRQAEQRLVATGIETPLGSRSLIRWDFHVSLAA